MASVDELNQENENVTGANPLSTSGGGAAIESNAPDQGASQGSGGQIQSGQDINAMQSQGSATNKKASPASSGMFTNIQKYVNKNKPQAQKMAGAVTQDFSKQASEIRKAAEDKANQQSTLIGANQKAIDTATGQAGAMVGSITGGSGNVADVKDQARYMDQMRNSYETSQLGDKYDQYKAEKDALKGNQYQTGPGREEAMKADSDALRDKYFTSEMPTFETYQGNKFQDLMKGNVAGTQQVGDLDLAKQQMRTQELGKLAQGAQTEQGRRNLLGQTFQKQGEYTRGMSGLDNLITAGDKSARENLIQGTQGAAQELGSGLQGISTDASNLKSGYQSALGNVAEDVSQMGSNATTGITTDVDAQIAAEKTARENLLAGFDTTKQNIQNRLDVLKNIYGGDLGAGTRLQSQLSGFHSPNMDLLNRYGIDTSKFSDFNDLKSQAFMSPEEAKMMGISADNAWTQASKGAQLSLDDVRSAYSGMNKDVSGFNVQNDLEQSLANQGSTYGSLKDQSDLTRANVGSEEQINKFNALKQLMGQSDEIATEGRKDYVSQEKLKELLSKYNLNK